MLLTPFGTTYTQAAADPVESLLQISTTQQQIGRGALSTIIMLIKVAITAAAGRAHQAYLRRTSQGFGSSSSPAFLSTTLGVDSTLFKLLPLCAAALYSRRLLAGSLGLSSLGGGVVSEGNREHGKSTTPS